MNLRMHILYEIKNVPWGGGNQFLKALRDQWRLQGVYEEDCEKAGGILFNSHHLFKKVIVLKRRYPEKIFVHRLDGIMTLTRNDPALDRMIYKITRLAADGIIFQSRWAKEKAYEMGCPREIDHRVIFNAPDPKIFYAKSGYRPHSPVKLIATSWSANARKGFDFLEWLDKNLDFSKYEMTFVGNSPVKFHNIKHIPPRDSQSLSGILRDHDIYIFAGKDDACPNGLIEALHCGLPVVFLDNGSNREIVQKAGFSFNSREELMGAIGYVSQNYADCQKAIDLPDIHSAAEQYYNFLQCLQEAKSGLKTRKISAISQLRFSFSSTKYSVCQMGKSVLTRIKA